MDSHLYQQIIDYRQKEKFPENLKTAGEKRKFKRQVHPYLQEGELLFRKQKGKLLKVLKQGETEAVLYLYHDNPVAGHFGYNKMFDKVRRNYYWPQMYEEIRKYVSSCYQCQMQASKRKNNELNPLEPTGAWRRVGIDFIGPLELTTKGNRYIITAMDYFTRWPEARAVPHANAEAAATFIYEDIICRHGIVDIIHTDQGTHFVNRMIEELCAKFQMKYHKVTAYHL